MGWNFACSYEISSLLVMEKGALVRWDAYKDLHVHLGVIYAPVFRMAPTMPREPFMSFVRYPLVSCPFWVFTVLTGVLRTFVI